MVFSTIFVFFQNPIGRAFLEVKRARREATTRFLSNFPFSGVPKMTLASTFFAQKVAKGLVVRTTRTLWERPRPDLRPKAAFLSIWERFWLIWDGF